MSHKQKVQPAETAAQPPAFAAALPNASLSRRLACMLYDGLLALAILFAGWLIPYTVLGLLTQLVPHASILWGHCFLLLFFYFGWLWLHGGQTLAMKTWRIRLISADGRAIRPLQALLRYCLAWPSLGLFGIGVIWSLLDQDGQFLHDRLAGTRLAATNSR